MDWRRLAVEDLRRYRELEASLTSLPERIAVLEAEALAIKGGWREQEPVTGGMSRSEDRLLGNIAERQRLQLHLRVVQGLAGMIRRALELLTAEERLALEYFYIQRPSGYLERLCGELGCERSAAYEIKNRALKRFTIAMYGLAEL